MKNYAELIEALRYLAKVYSICENENTQEYQLAVQAADAIEKLTVAQSTQTNAESTQKCVGSTHDCVSRQAALDALKRDEAYDKDIPNRADGVRDAIITIMGLPAAQPEIIRCKDCTHWSRESICDGFCSEDCMRHDEDFYCGYAERRTDERLNQPTGGNRCD